MQTAEVVIAGAGIAGIATAWQLAVRHGVTTVVLVDPLPPLTLTSNRTGANYRDWWPSRPMVGLARRSIDLMRELAHDGATFTLNRRGYLYVSTRPDFSEQLPALLQPYREAGLGPVRIHHQGPASEDTADLEGADALLDRDAIRRAHPHLSPTITGAIQARNAGTLETVGLGRHLLQAATQRGVSILRGDVVRVDIEGGRVSGVGIREQGGTRQISTHHFVNAAGPFAVNVARLVGIDLPLVNVLQQKVALADPRGVVPPGAPFTISLDPAGSLPGGLHIKPDALDGRAVVKVGCAFNRKSEEPAWEPVGTAEFSSLVLAAAAQLVPGLERYARDAQVVAHEAGYYTRTPDDLPLIGPLGCDGAYVVAGLAGYGAMVACAAGEIAASWLAAGRAPGGTPDFTAGRFSHPERFAATSEGSSTGAL